MNDYADSIDEVVNNAESSTVTLDDGSQVQVGLDAVQSNTMPTLLLKNAIKEFLRNYDMLFGPSYL
ncbi:MAG: hypothetical protein GXP45_00315 [bacterium]|nr:hypothetical protein [bacterium]